MLLYSTYLFSQKVFLFCSKLARKGETAQVAWRNEHLLCKMLKFKNHNFVVRNWNLIVMVFKVILQLFENCVVGAL